MHQSVVPQQFVVSHQAVVPFMITESSEIISGGCEMKTTTASGLLVTRYDSVRIHGCLFEIIVVISASGLVTDVPMETASAQYKEEATDIPVHRAGAEGKEKRRREQKKNREKKS